MDDLSVAESVHVRPTWPSYGAEADAPMYVPQGVAIQIGHRDEKCSEANSTIGSKHFDSIKLAKYVK